MNYKNEITVGLLFTIALVILGYFTIVVRHEVFEPRDAYTMSVIFPNVEGLEKGDDVKVNGVKAGIVENISLQNEYVSVLLKMYSRFTMFESYKIKIASESALGGKFIAIYPGEKMKLGVEHAVVSTRTNLKGISGGDPIALISALVEENRTNIYNTISNLEQITSKINRGQGTLGKLINESQVHEDAGDLLKEARDTLEDAREQAPVTSFIRAALTFF